MISRRTNTRVSRRNNRKPLRARRRAHRPLVGMEMLEPRTLLTAGYFLQGTAFVDAVPYDSKLGAGDVYKSGQPGAAPKATIQLWDQTETHLLGSMPTDSNGAYLFDDANVDHNQLPQGLVPGTYRLVEVPPLGYQANDVQILSTLSTGTKIDSDTIEVTLPDITGLTVQYVARGANEPLYVVAPQGSGGTYAGQMIMKANLPSAPEVPFYSMCVSFQGEVHPGDPAFPVVPKPTYGFIPTPAAGMPTNAGRIGYLYNHYGTTVETDPVSAAALQLAVWELVYDTTPDLDHGNFLVYGAVDPAVLPLVKAQAYTYMAESLGKSETCVFLDAERDTGHFQSVLAAESFNFANRQGTRSHPTIDTVAGGTVVIGSGIKLTDTAELAGGDNPTGTITFTLYNPSNAVVYTNVVTVNGNGTYTTATGTNPGGYLPTVTGTYLWTAAYSGDSNNEPAVDNGQNESEVVSKAGPAINTVAGDTIIIGSGENLNDTAILSGGYNPTGTITFTLYSPSNAAVYTNVVTVTGNGTYTTATGTNPGGYLPMETGTYLWSAAYSGDANNTPAVDNGQNEHEAVVPASPAINTSQLPAVATVGTAIADKATVTGGYNPTGTVTFYLYDNPDGTGLLFTDTEPLVGGVAISASYLTTATGTDYWVAQYNGDANNNAAISGAEDEPVVINPAQPAINTSQLPAVATVGTAIADKATVTGGYNPTGTVTFYLYDNPDGTGLLFTDTEPLVGGVAISASYVATATGTDYWVAKYNGDSNNNAAISGAEDEPVVINPAQPAINTSQLPAVATVGTAIADKATVTGGYNPTGTVTFYLYDNPDGTGLLFTDTQPLVGGVAISASYVATATGTDYWVAKYSGDANNNAAISGAEDEPVVINPDQPAINTSQLPAVATVGTPIADKATVTGGYNPTGTVTFYLYDNPDGTGLLFTDTEPLVGGVAISASYVATAAGTNYWVAQYNGDSNNNAAISGAEDEPVLVNPAQPAINTVAGGTVVIGSGAKLTDTAVLSGGYNPTGTITFTLYNPGNVAVYTNVVTVSGNGTYTTATGTNPGGYLPSETGTYLWSAVYSGDGNNSGAADNGQNENEFVDISRPAINTVAGGTVVIGSGAKLTDTAVLSGGYNPTGTITFTLYNPSNVAVYTDVVTVSGNGTYTTATGTNPGGYLPTVTGTYLWSAVYSGDGNNSGAQDNGQNENEAVTKAGPAIHTTPFATTVTMGGHFATIGFWHNRNGQALINSFDGSASSQALGNWLAAASNFPRMFGVPNPYTAATLAGFSASTCAGLTNTQIAKVYLDLWTPNGLQKNTYVQAFAVALGLYASGGQGSYNVGSNGAAFGVADNTVLTVAEVLKALDANFSPATGLFYGGDSAKTSAANNVLNAINNSGEHPCGGTIVCTTALLKDSATLSGGYNETGTITFLLFAPGASSEDLPIYSEEVVVHGNGTYTTAVGYQATTAGTYQWVAIYSGDANNSSVISPFGSEPWTVGQANPTVLTTTPNVTCVTLGTSAVVLKDTALLQDGVNPTGTITFTLVAPNGAIVDTETVAVNGNGSYTTPAGYTLTTTIAMAGTYQWNAVYSGDANNVGDEFNNDPSERVAVHVPDIHIVKCGPATVMTGQSATFTYTVTNPGDVPLSNVTVVDDNGTPGKTSDDFQPTYVSGDTNSNGLLDTTETWTYTATVPLDLAADSSLSAFVASLPSQVTMVLASPGTALPPPSYYDVTITNGGSLNGVYNDWCVDTSRGITAGQAYTAKVYSSTATLPSGLVDKPQNLDLVNWVLNQGFVGRTAAGGLGTYTYGDVQRAIWTLVENTNSTSGLGSYSQARVDSIVAQANAQGEGFLPQSGQFVAVVLQPVNSSNCTTAQITIAEVLIGGVGPSCTYTNVATATGSYCGVTVTDHDSHTVTIVPPCAASISGVKYRDMTGNGLTLADDTPLGGMTIDLFVDANGNGTLDGGDGNPVATKVTASGTGAYSFSNLTPGLTYFVQEEAMTGYVRTYPALSNYYTVTPTAGGSSTGNDFANFQKGDCLSHLTGIQYFVVNAQGTTQVPDLRGNTEPGDTVRVTFTVTGTSADRATVTLVSYNAPDPIWVPEHASQQTIYQQAGGTYAPGTYTISVALPCGDYQVDFVCGPAIDQLGPVGSNIFYSAQGRLISADNNGPGVISGTVFADSKNLDCVQQAGESGIGGVTVKLIAAGPDCMFWTSDDVTVKTTTTNGAGRYIMTDVAAGQYMIVETTRSGYIHVGQDAGTAGGTLAPNAIAVAFSSNDTSIRNNFSDFQIPAGQPAGAASFTKNFSSTAIPQKTSGAQNYVWFNTVATVNPPAGTSLSGAVVFLVDQAVQFSFTISGKTYKYNLLVPNARVTFSSTATTARTTFDAASNTWQTTLPASVSGNVFLAGLTLPVPATGLPANLNVAWTGNFISNVDRLSATWKWGAGVYKAFDTDYNKLNVKPVDSSSVYCVNSVTGATYRNSDKAGTPECFKSSVTSSSMGTALSGPSTAIVACDPPLVADPPSSTTVAVAAKLPAGKNVVQTTTTKAKPTAKATKDASDKYFAGLASNQTTKGSKKVAVKSSKVSAVKTSVRLAVHDACMVKLSVK